MSPSSWVRWGACALALASSLARAEEPRPTATEEIVVEAPRIAAARDPTSATTVVEVERFAGESKDVAALLATAPGVAVQQYGGLGQLATVSIRGASADGVKVLLDGLPLNSAAGGGVDLSTIPPAWVDRIEVVRGAEGARYGQGALGGVVNVITRRAAAGRWSAQASGGSFDTGSAMGDAAVGGEAWGVLLSAGADATGGRFPYLHQATPTVPGPLVPSVRTHDASASGGLMAKGWSQAGAGRLDVLLQVSGGGRELPGWPYALTPEDRQREGRAAGAAGWTGALSESVSLSAQLRGRADRLDLRLPSAGLGEVRQRDVAAGAGAELSWERGPNTLQAGVAAGGESLEATGLGPARSRAELAAFAADDLLLGDRFRLSPAVRAEQVGRFQGLSGKLGASARLWGPLSARASAGRTFRAPSFAELFLEQGLLRPNPDLRPEQGLSADAALAAEGPPGLLRLGGFLALYRDLIVYQQVSFDRLAPVNGGRSAVGGLEAELATAPLGRLGASAALAYTFLATRTLRGQPEEVGKDVPRRPRHRLFARAGVAPGPLELHAEAHLVSRQWLDMRNAVAVPEALTFHAGASLRLRRRPEVRLHLEVRNLADDRTLQDTFGNPLPGRMVLVALRVASPGPDRTGGER